jgi:hypothetical protein
MSEESRGEIAAVVAVAGAVDHDGDVILSGAIPWGSPVLVSDWSHGAALRGTLPVGAGRIYEEGDEYVFRGRHYLDTPHGAAAHSTFRQLLEDQVPVEWSLVFPKSEVELGQLTPSLRAAGAKRAVAFMRPVEVSPVLMAAAGRRSRTIAAKRDVREAAAHDAAAREEFERLQRARSRVSPVRFDMREYWKLSDEEFQRVYARWKRENA